MNLHRQRGFTLIELMIALVVSTLLVGLILSIFSRMSLAYRGQQQIAGVQQVLAAARATIEMDAKQAGFAVPQGFKIAADPALKWPVRIVDSATAPDQIAFFYADSTAQAVVTGPSLTMPTLGFDNASGFAKDDLVVLTIPTTSTNSPVDPLDPNIATYDSCVLMIDTVTGNSVKFHTDAPWGSALLTHCTAPAAGTIMYKFVAHGYRIDQTPAKKALGALQQSTTGGLFSTDALNNWQDIAYGFTDIQTALQVYETKDTIDTPDPDTDPERDWYSGALQSTKTGTDGSTPVNPPLEMTISLVARTDRDIEGITTDSTPQLVDPANVDNNTLGNRPLISLPSATDLALQGSRIYRYITFSVDFRNIGVGE